MRLRSAWKVRRELARIRDKVLTFIGRHVHDPIRKPIYDLTARWRQRLTLGHLPLTDRVAVFVIFQPKGLPASIYLTLEHLRQNRYSVLLVSNGALSPEDRARLSQDTALVLERPNVGYDFGGYRDGIRQLWSFQHDLSRLVLMNDSTWFPLRRDDDSLARMEALDADLAGHIFKTESAKRPENDHLESHLLMISSVFVQSRDFYHFWSRYCMSDRRSTTITFGEKALSQLAIHSGRRIGALMDREWLLSVLQSLPDADMEQVLQHTIDSFNRRRPDLTQVRQRFVSGDPWREDYIAWADHALRNSTSYLLSAAFVMPALVYGRMGFAKKANDIRFHMAREELLDLEASGMIPPLADEVRSEVGRMVEDWIPPKGQEQTVRPRISAASRVAP